MSKADRAAVVYEKMRQGCEKMSRPFEAPSLTHIPPLLGGDDALVRRLAYGWYLAKFPRNDLLVANGTSKEVIDSHCSVLRDLTRLPKLSLLQRKSAGDALKSLNATKERIVVPQDCQSAIGTSAEE